MQLDLDTINPEFTVKPNEIAGTKVYLVFPSHMGVPWTSSNIILRSSIWDEDGYLISASFKKFFNWSEKDNIIPPPDSIIGTTAVEKIDGSALIVSKYKGQLIARTRGTFDASMFESNGFEIAVLKHKYPLAFEPPDNTSLIFEWYSPLNKIVLDYGTEPLLFLTGAVNHEDYSYFPQTHLDKLSITIKVPRPKTFTFASIDALLEDIKNLHGQEGCCLYYNNDQSIKKVKSTAYLAMHAFKSELSINNLLDLYISQGMPDYQSFMDHIENTYDYECMVMAIGPGSKICNAKQEADRIVDHMKQFAAKLPKDKKAGAELVFGAYGKTNRAGMVFAIRDHGDLNPDSYKKLIHQILPR